MRHQKLHIIFIVLVFCFSSCGRKQRNIFNFSETNKLKINKLTLPAVKGVKVKKINNENVVEWLEVKSNDKDMKLLGYNIYRLTRGYFAPKKPMNSKIITGNIFVDQHPKSNYPNCYFVTPVFSKQDQFFEGPISQIISIK